MKGSEKILIIAFLWFLTLVLIFKEILILSLLSYFSFWFLVIKEKYFFEFKKSCMFALLSAPIVYVSLILDSYFQLEGSLRLMISLPIITIGAFVFSNIKRSLSLRD
ncbi:membrane hypothetical protein [Vibrio coralliirubri]|nr:membrane hypothetical protein [Vibrio coralliirubri]